MASIEVLNATQANVEAPVEIQLSLGNPIYRGPEGRPGRDGEIGRDGKSAYEIAVENGFEGTEAQWLVSLKGADGAPGQDGATGQIGPQGPKGDTPIKGVDYFTEQDIDDFIAQVPEPDLSDYKEIINIEVPNLVEDNINLNILTQDQQDIFFNIYQKFINREVLPDIWINGYHILFCNTTYATSSNNTFFDLYAFSSQLSVGDYQLSSGLKYNKFELLINGNNTGLYDGRLDWRKNVSYAANAIPLQRINIAGHNSSNVGDAIRSIVNAYATKAEVETAIRGAESGLLKRSVVQALPVSEIDDNTIYMVPKTGSTGDVYDEYLYVDNVWEHIGSTDIDLTGYATISYVNSKISSFKIINATGPSVAQGLSADDQAYIVDAYNNLLVGYYFVIIHNSIVYYPWYVDSSTKNLFFTNGKDFITAGGLKMDNTPGSATAITVGSWTTQKRITWNVASGSSSNDPFLNSSSTTIAQAFQYIKNNYIMAAPPVSDGDYLLKCSVSSGTAAYAWENVVVGGSY